MRQLKVRHAITNRNSISFEKYLTEVGRIKPFGSPSEESEIAKKAKDGDECAIKDLVVKNLRFVISVAKQYQRQGYPILLEDLVNEGNCGLIKAASRFDDSRGFKFISYAVWWIRQSILLYIAENGRSIRIPQNKNSQLNKIRTVSSKLEQELEREPTVNEINECMGWLSSKDIEFLLGSERSIRSLDAKIEDGEDGTFMTLIEDKNSPCPDDGTHKEDLKNRLTALLERLHYKERIVLIGVFGLDGNETKTLEEIGEGLELSRERVRQIRDAALRRCKKILHNNPNELMGYL